MTILDALNDPTLFRPYFDPDTWRAWRVFLSSVFALPIAEADADLYQRCTGRTRPQRAPAVEAWMVVGRRGGKSRIAALIAIYLAVFRDYREFLAPGEVGTLPIIAQDRKGARTVMRYLTGLFHAVPMLRELLACEPTKETIELRNRVVIEVMTASVAAVRNYTIIGAVLDEVAFWDTDEDAAEPDVAIIQALEPGMGTIPNAVLIALSSPYGRQGALFEAYRDHFGRDDDDVLVWRASTGTMHPHAPQSRLGRQITKAYRKDPTAAAAEYGGQFRSDLEAFVSRDVLAACVIGDRQELPPSSGIRFKAFVDVSAGSSDSTALAIGHGGPGVVIVDVLREWRPPFDPQEVVAECGELLARYHCKVVAGDRFGGEWVVSAFKNVGVTYQPAEMNKSQLYSELLYMLNSRCIQLLDNQRLIHQLLGLERRTGSSGRDIVDHQRARGAHDDCANVVAGLAAAVGRPRPVPVSRAQPPAMNIASMLADASFIHGW